jgi:hypothetical protein
VQSVCAIREGRGDLRFVQGKDVMPESWSLAHATVPLTMRWPPEALLTIKAIAERAGVSAADFIRLEAMRAAARELDKGGLLSRQEVCS